MWIPWWKLVLIVWTRQNKAQKQSSLGWYTPIHLGNSPAYSLEYHLLMQKELAYWKYHRLRETTSLSLTACHFWASKEKLSGFQRSTTYLFIHRNETTLLEINIPYYLGIESFTTSCCAIYANLPDAGIWKRLGRMANLQSQERNKHHNSSVRLPRVQGIWTIKWTPHRGSLLWQAPPN